MVYSLSLMVSGAFMGFVYLRMSAIAAKTRVARAGKVVFALPIAVLVLILVMVDVSTRSAHYAPAFIAGAGLPFASLWFRAPKSR